MSSERYSDGRLRWLQPRENDELRSETGSERKRARQKDPSRAEAMAARRPYGRALDILKEQEDGDAEGSLC